MNDLVYRPNYFGFAIILTADYWSGFERIINQFLDPTHLEGCYVTFNRGSFVDEKYASRGYSFCRASH